MDAIQIEDCNFIQRVRDEVNDKMFGLKPVVDALLVALTTRGHVLLEGNPGLGKTVLVKTISQALGLPSKKVGRIQFTPDLMPSDITGTLMPDADKANHLTFQEGPIFRWILLADEINRASPKTQSAMLEAMAERQVTVLGETWPLTPPQIISLKGKTRSIEPPFMVMATQNPIDLEGTYELPEAQSDRFMFKIRMPFPNPDVLGNIIDKETHSVDPQSDDTSTEIIDDPEAYKESLFRLWRIGNSIRAAKPMKTVRDHIINMVIASKGRLEDQLTVGQRHKAALQELVNEYFEFPLGPRAAFSLMLGAKAWDVVVLTKSDELDLIGSRTNVGLSQTALPALRHRLKLRLDWEARYRERVSSDAGVSTEDLHDKLLQEFVLLSAPEEHGYRETLEAGFLKNRDFT